MVIVRLNKIASLKFRLPTWNLPKDYLQCQRTVIYTYTLFYSKKQQKNINNSKKHFSMQKYTNLAKITLFSGDAGWKRRISGAFKFQFSVYMYTESI